MTDQPDNGAPMNQLPPANTAAGSTATTPVRRVVAMSAKKSFQATTGAEKLKAYLREVPKIHDQLRQIVESLRVTTDALRITTESVQRLVRNWEEEERHGRAGEPHGGAGPAPVVPPAAPDPATGDAQGGPPPVPAP